MDRRYVKGGIENHGMHGTAEYNIWATMIQRCHNPNNPAYADYGGRGIAVCGSWLDSFQAFYRDMGPRPGSEYSLDRRENDLGYSKDNCRWATAQEQAENRSSTRWVEYRGERITATGLGLRSGNSVNTILNRLARGDSPEQASRPVQGAKLYTYNGESLTLKQWEVKVSVSRSTLFRRLQQGWPLGKALTTPAYNLPKARPVKIES